MVYNEILMFNCNDVKDWYMPDSDSYDNTHEHSQKKESKPSWWFDRLRSLWFFITYLCAGVPVGIWGRPRNPWVLLAAFLGAGASNAFSISTIYYSARKVDKIRHKNDIHDKECRSWAKIHAAFVSSLFLMQIAGIFLEDTKVKNIADAYALIAIGMSHQLFARENRLRSKGQTCSYVRLQQRLCNASNLWIQRERDQLTLSELYDHQRAARGYIEKTLELLQGSKNVIARLQADGPEDFVAVYGARINSMLQTIDIGIANLQQVNINVHTAIAETRKLGHFNDSSDQIYMADSQDNTNSGDSGSSDGSIANGSSTEHSINSEMQSYVRAPELLLNALTLISNARGRVVPTLGLQGIEADFEQLKQVVATIDNLDDAIGKLRSDVMSWTIDHLVEYNGRGLSMS